MKAQLHIASLVVLYAATAFAQEPSWPQSFQLPMGETRGYGVGVTQPGPITVNVTSQGAPILVTLYGPLAQPVQQAGSGNLVLTQIVTPAEIQKSSIWVVNIAAATPPQSITVPPPIIAQGTVSVQHAPADARVLQTEIQTRTTALRRTTPAQAGRVLAPAAAATKQTAYLSQVATQQGAQRQALMAQIRPVSTAARITPQAPSGRPGGVPVSGSLPTGGQGAAPVPPQITALSTDRGQPGDSILITGNGFGSTPAEVHFIVNPGPPTKDLVATQVDYWSDSQVLVHVPLVDKIPAYAGQIYLKTGGGVSPFRPFQFNPQLQYVTLDVATEQVLVSGGGFVQYLRPGTCDTYSGYINGWTSGTSPTAFDPNGCIFHDVSGTELQFRWISNDDQIFPYLKLINGWVLDSVEFRSDTGVGGGANIAEKHEGTSSPYVKVHWWVNPFGGVIYTLGITIRGPSGMPYR